MNPNDTSIRTGKKKKKNRKKDLETDHNYKYTYVKHEGAFEIVKDWKDSVFMDNIATEVNAMIRKVAGIQLNTFTNLLKTNKEEFFAKITADWLGPFLHALLLLLQNYSLCNQGTGASEISLLDVIDWYRIECLRSYFKIPVSDIFAKETRNIYSNVIDEKLMEFVKKKYGRINFLRSRRSTFGEKDFSSNQGMKNLETNVNEICQRALVNLAKIYIALDDRKIHDNSKECKREGYDLTRFRDGDFGRVMLGFASIGINMYLGGRFRYIDENEKTCIDRMLHSVWGEKVLSERNIRPTIIPDRGLHLDKFRDEILKYGASITATKPHIEAQLGFEVFPADFITLDECINPKPKKLKIGNAGGNCNYIAKSSIKIEKKTLYIKQQAIRNGSRLFFIESLRRSQKGGTTVYHFSTKYENKKKHDELHLKVLTKCHTIIENSIYDGEYYTLSERWNDELEKYVAGQSWWTVAQVTPEWFEMRKFSLTSSISIRILPTFLMDLQYVATKVHENMSTEEEKKNILVLNLNYVNSYIAKILV